MKTILTIIGIASLIVAATLIANKQSTITIESDSVDFRTNKTVLKAEYIDASTNDQSCFSDFEWKKKALQLYKENKKYDCLTSADSADSYTRSELQKIVSSRKYIVEKDEQSKTLKCSERIFDKEYKYSKSCSVSITDNGCWFWSHTEKFTYTVTVTPLLSCTNIMSKYSQQINGDLEKGCCLGELGYYNNRQSCSEGQYSSYDGAGTLYSGQYALSSC